MDLRNTSRWTAALCWDWFLPSTITRNAHNGLRKYLKHERHGDIKSAVREWRKGGEQRKEVPDSGEGLTPEPEGGRGGNDTSFPLFPLDTILQVRNHTKTSVTQQCVKLSLPIKSITTDDKHQPKYLFVWFMFCSGHINYSSIRIELLQSGMKTPLNVILEAYCFRLVCLLKTKQDATLAHTGTALNVALAICKLPVALCLRPPMMG